MSFSREWCQRETHELVTEPVWTVTGESLDLAGREFEWTVHQKCIRHVSRPTWLSRITSCGTSSRAHKAQSVERHVYYTLTLLTSPTAAMQRFDEPVSHAALGCPPPAARCSLSIAVDAPSCFAVPELPPSACLFHRRPPFLSIMSKAASPFTPSHPSYVRPLGPLEQWFHTLNSRHPNHFCTVAELAGDITPALCKQALGAVQARHPLLNVAIARDEAGEFAYQRGEGSIPLRIVNSSRTTWEKEVADEMTQPFDINIAPLIRAVLLTAAQQQPVLILTAAHVVGDGMSLIFVVRDMVQTMCGQQLLPLDVPSSAEELHKAYLASSAQQPAVSIVKRIKPEPEEATTTAAAAPRPATPWRPFPTRSTPPTIHSVRLSSYQTSSVAAACRQHGVTVHAALTAAVVLAGRQLSARWRELPVRVFSPANLRARLRAGDGVHNCVSGGATQLAPPAAASLWTVARQARHDLAPFLTHDGHFTINSMIGSVVADASGAVSGTSLHMGYEFILTNPGRVELDLPASSDATITALHGPCVVLGFEEEQAVAALTFDGRLSLTHCSYSPIDGLLELAVQQLIGA